MTTVDDGTVSRVVSRDGTEIGYWTNGEGPPLVLVHGLLGDHSRWAALQGHFTPHFTVHAMDRRGRGASGDAPDYEPFREVEDVVAVVEAVAEAAGTGVDLYGSSGGGIYSLAAATRTSSIRRLVLFEPPAGAGPELKPPGLQEELDALMDAGDREGVLVTTYRRLVGLSDGEIDELRTHPAWPNRLAAAHTVPRELRHAPRDLFDLSEVADIAVPTLVLVAGQSPEIFQVCAQTRCPTRGPWSSTGTVTVRRCSEPRPSPNRCWRSSATRGRASLPRPGRRRSGGGSPRRSGGGPFGHRRMPSVLPQCGLAFSSPRDELPRGGWHLGVGAQLLGRLVRPPAGHA